MKKDNLTKLIVMGILIGVIYVFFSPSQYGVKVSCDGKEILGISKVPPPLMCAACMTCDVEIQTKYENTTICSSSARGQVEKPVIYCEDIEQYKGKEVTVTANFYSNGNKIGSDSKKLTVP